jgi:hypothetical protein
MGISRAPSVKERAIEGRAWQWPRIDGLAEAPGEEEKRTGEN